jgi:hypothetical protein
MTESELGFSSSYSALASFAGFVTETVAENVGVLY